MNKISSNHLSKLWLVGIFCYLILKSFLTDKRLILLGKREEGECVFICMKDNILLLLLLLLLLGSLSTEGACGKQGEGYVCPTFFFLLQIPCERSIFGEFPSQSPCITEPRKLHSLGLPCNLGSSMSLRLFQLDAPTWQYDRKALMWRRCCGESVPMCSRCPAFRSTRTSSTRATISHASALV